ncbi:MAG TPA: N-acetyltransferase [Ruminococcaceae bacterium]|jgi:GNAT superfamily N-acetyltransferase|nr:N-acetyltransferase [Oscillospiraceae bacterium]
MEAIIADQIWQKAGVYYVRTQATVMGDGVPLDHEFDGKDRPDTLYSLVLDGIRPIGTCRLNRVDDATAKIERVCVLEEYRKRGAGRLAVQKAEEYFREHGYQRVVITSKESAVGFYEKLGYTADYSVDCRSKHRKLIYMKREIVE